MQTRVMSGWGARLDEHGHLHKELETKAIISLPWAYYPGVVPTLTCITAELSLIAEIGV